MEILEQHNCKKNQTDNNIYKYKVDEKEWWMKKDTFWAVGGYTNPEFDVAYLNFCPYCGKDLYEKENKKIELEKIERRKNRHKHYKKKAEDAFEKVKTFKFPSKNKLFDPKMLWWYAVSYYYINRSE